MNGVIDRTITLEEAMKAFCSGKAYGVFKEEKCNYPKNDKGLLKKIYNTFIDEERVMNGIQHRTVRNSISDEKTYWRKLLDSFSDFIGRMYIFDYFKEKEND